MAEGYQEHKPVLATMSPDAISGSDDLNNYTTMGCWKTGGDLPSHAPSGATWSQLYVIAVGTSIMQIIANGGTIWMRNGSTSSNVWYNWYKYTGTAI